jgi:transglutaminase-like putative cysteine protease
MLPAMPFLALIENREVEYADAAALRAAFRSGEIQAETWVLDVDVEAAWAPLAEHFPEILD